MRQELALLYLEFGQALAAFDACLLSASPDRAVRPTDSKPASPCCTRRLPGTATAGWRA